MFLPTQLACISVFGPHKRLFIKKLFDSITKAFLNVLLSFQNYLYFTYIIL